MAQPSLHDNSSRVRAPTHQCQPASGSSPSAPEREPWSTRICGFDIPLLPPPYQTNRRRRPVALAKNYPHYSLLLEKEAEQFDEEAQLTRVATHTEKFEAKVRGSVFKYQWLGEDVADVLVLGRG